MDLLVYVVSSKKNHVQRETTFTSNIQHTQDDWELRQNPWLTSLTPVLLLQT
jgi:hypothetical protein